MTSHSISYLESLKSAFYSTVLDVIHVVKVVVVDSFYYIYGFMTNQSSTGELRSFYCGKVILITGASSGIGEALVKTLSSIPGTILIISSRRIENLIEVADSCRVSMPNAKILPVELDLEKYDDMESYMSRVLAVLKDNGLPSRIDVLINNAGISSRGAAMNTSLTTLERVMVSLMEDSLDRMFY